MVGHKIIHVLYSGLGGHGNVVFSLLESKFGERNENVLVFFGIENVIPSYLEAANELGVKTYSILKKPRQYRQPFSDFKEILRIEEPDRIIVHNSELILPAIHFSKRNEYCKVYYVEHQSNASKGFILQFLSKYTLKRADAVVCLSEAYATELTKKFTAKVPVKVIPNGINTARYKPTNSSNDGLVIGMASRMIPGKDHPTLLHAFKRILKKYPHAVLEIAGEGTTSEAIKALSSKLKLSGNVRFLGLLDESEMLTFYERLSIYVLATEYETLSTAILQAMACGLPVITSGIANNKTIISAGENGWLYLPGSPEDLAIKLEEIIENPDSTIKIAASAREHILKNYSNQQMAKGYQQLVDQD